MKYSIYKKNTGLLIGSGCGSVEQMLNILTSEPECDFYLNCPPDATHIINNEPVIIIQEPTPAEIAKRLTDTAQRHLDNQAKQRGYDGILSLCSYIDSTDQGFKAEAEAGMVCRDAVWRFMYQLQVDLQAGSVLVPTDNELVAMLPRIVW